MFTPLVVQLAIRIMIIRVLLELGAVGIEAGLLTSVLAQNKKAVITVVFLCPVQVLLGLNDTETP